MKRIILIGICLLNFGCQDEHKTSKTYYPDVLLVQTKDPNGNLNWVCMAVSGGGYAENAQPAVLEVWEPDAQGNCFKPKSK